MVLAVIRPESRIVNQPITNPFMKLVAIVRYLRLIACVLAGFGLRSLPLNAQTFRGRNTLAESPSSLRSRITPVWDSPMVWIRFEHEGRAPVRIRIRNKNKEVLLDEVDRNGSRPVSLILGLFPPVSTQSS